jgi:hypothetical protein
MHWDSELRQRVRRPSIPLHPGRRPANGHSAMLGNGMRSLRRLTQSPRRLGCSSLSAVLSGSTSWRMRPGQHPNGGDLFPEWHTNSGGCPQGDVPCLDDPAR